MCSSKNRWYPKIGQPMCGTRNPAMSCRAVVDRTGAADPTSFVEVFKDVALPEMCQHIQRVVPQDKLQCDRRQALHAGQGKPKVRIFAVS